jgi:hypothetical protein
MRGYQNRALVDWRTPLLYPHFQRVAMVALNSIVRCSLESFYRDLCGMESCGRERESGAGLGRLDISSL